MQQEARILDRAEARRFAIGDQQLIERQIDRVERLPERQRNFASTVRAGVSGADRGFWKEASSRRIERRLTALDFERGRLQRKIGGETCPNVLLDHDGYRT